MDDRLEDQELPRAPRGDREERPEANPYAPPPEQDDFMAWKTATPEELERYANEYQERAYNAYDLVRESNDLGWVIEGMIQQGSLTLVNGQPKVSRKSLLCMGLAVGISRRQQVLGLKTKQGSVTLTNLEDGHRRLARRLGDFGVRYVHPSRRNPNRMIWVGDTYASLQNLTFWIAAHKPILNVLDPLAELASGRGIRDENDASEMTNLLQPWRELMQDTDTGGLLVHHLNKEGKVSRGSSAIDAAADGWWMVHAVADDTHVIQTVSRDDRIHEIDVHIRYEGQQVSIVAASPLKRHHSTSKELKNRGVDAYEEQQMLATAKLQRLLMKDPDRIWTQDQLRTEAGITLRQCRTAIASFDEAHNIKRQVGKGICWAKADAGSKAILDITGE